MARVTSFLILAKLFRAPYCGVMFSGKFSFMKSALISFSVYIVTFIICYKFIYPWLNDDNNVERMNELNQELVSKSIHEQINLYRKLKKVDCDTSDISSDEPSKKLVLDYLQVLRSNLEGKLTEYHVSVAHKVNIQGALTESGACVKT